MRENLKIMKEMWQSVQRGDTNGRVNKKSKSYNRILV